MMITTTEMNRYIRQTGIQGWGAEGQERLKNSTAFIAGAGGLGSAVLYYLASCGTGVLRICDYDTVEISNLNRQILHGQKDIGKTKTESALETLSELNPYIRIVPLKERLTPANADDLVGDADIILDCLDNFPARMIINRIAVNRSIPMVHAGISAFQGQLIFLHPPDTPCLACIFPKEVPSKTTQVIGATAGIMGSLQALEAIKYLSGIGGNMKHRMLFFDGNDMSFETMKIVKNPDCTVCGSKTR